VELEVPAPLERQRAEGLPEGLDLLVGGLGGEFDEQYASDHALILAQTLPIPPSESPMG